MKEKEEKINFKYNKYNRYTFKRKDSKQTKVTLLIKDYFNNHTSLTKDKFDEFLIFIDLKSIWKKEEEQDILWDVILSYSKNKNGEVNYDAAFKGIMELFKNDDEENKNNKKSNNYSIEYISETFDKFLKSLNGNQEFLYDIEFINYIFLDKDDINLNNNSIENIISDIKSKYKFISINEKEIKSYFNCFNYNANKGIINNINTLIENNLSEINKNNNNGIYNDHSNNNSRSISSASDNIINANSFSLSQGELFDKLLSLDKIIFDCIDSLIYFYKNKNLINLTKKYIQNYLLFSKNNIYNNLKIIIENDNKIRISDLKNSVHNEDNNISNININNNINSNNNINNIINNFDLTKTEKPKSKYLSKRELTYIKKDFTEEKTYNDILNKNKKININNNIINDNIDIDDNNYNNNIEYKSNINKNDEDLKNLKIGKKGNHSRNKSDTHEKLISLNFNKKLKKNISYCNLKLNQIKESNLFNLDNNKSKNLSRNNNYTEKKVSHTQRDDESPSLGGSIEDLKVFTFSDNINDQYLVQTANIDNLENLDDNIEKGTPTLNPLDHLNKDSYFNDDLDYYGDFFKENKIEINNNDNDIDIDNEQNININKEKHNISNNLNNFTFGKAENIENENINIKLSGDIDSNLPIFSRKKKYMNIGHYDFRYLYKDSNIKKLFNINKEKINPMKFLTDEVYIISNNYLKKQKAILVISSSFFYLLKATITMPCITKLDIKSLNSIFISSRNCNLIYFAFENSVDIIIETYRRLEILKFIKGIKEKNIKINISHNFAPKKSDVINLKKTKIFKYTPNFENAIKLGILYKFQENFFINKFHERLVALCGLGLMYFEENDKCPKAVIPIIGSTIKFVFYQVDRLYCFQLKTINDESYTFGSKIKKETLDWIQEFSNFKTKFFLKLKEVEPNIMVHVKSKNHKQKGYK